MKTFKIVNGDMSDGYHTFDELYEHRVLLWLTVCQRWAEHVSFVADHFDGWDLVRLDIDGIQIGYHIPNKYRDFLRQNFQPISAEESDATFDGHTGADVLERLKKLMGML